MKKHFFLYLLVIVISFPVFCQENSPAVTPRSGNIFLELGGNAGILSLNYDKRFSKRTNGFGARIGVGVDFVPNHMLFDIITTVPVALNYLAFKGPHYLEAGAGLTAGFEKFGKSNFDERRYVFFIPSLGYRYQPFERGVTFRAFVSPYISDKMYYYAGISTGISF